MRRIYDSANRLSFIGFGATAQAPTTYDVDLPAMQQELAGRRAWAPLRLPLPSEVRSQ